MTEKACLAIDSRPLSADRRGVSLLECVAAVCVLGLLLSGMIQVLFLLAAQLQRSERRAAAMDVAANVLDQAAALPWSQLTPRALEALADQVDPEFSVQWRLFDDGAEARQIKVQVGWDDHGANVGLSTWRYVDLPLEIETDAATDKGSSIGDDPT